MADTVKCPNCGGNLIFDADLQELTCSFCGTHVKPGDLETKVDELEDQSGKTNGDLVEYICNSCGAKVLADKETSASFCAFCGSPALIGQKLTREFRPSYIIPFKYGKEKAKEGFLKWCKGGRLSPFGFASDRNIEKITGLYVPYWLSDIKGHMDRGGLGAREVRRPDGYLATEFFDFDMRGDFTWNNVPLDALTKLDDPLMEAIEPFDFKELVPFDYKYIPGFFADCYELEPKDLESRIRLRGDEYMSQEFRMAASKFDSFEEQRVDDEIEHEEKYALLPVWFFTYRYLGKTYSFAMNGQTGEVAGLPPVSLVKRIVIGAAILAVLAVIVKFIASLILWGAVG